MGHAQGRAVLEPDEFREFFLPVYPQLVRYVRQFHDPSVAEDLASKTMEDIWYKAKPEPAPTDEHSFFRLRKLAFAILRRHIGHQIRDELAQHRREDAFVAEQTTQAGAPDIADDITEPDWPEWLEDLRKEERELLILHANGYKPAEIAPILGVLPSAVSARLQRVREKARTLWRKEASDEQKE